MCKQNISGLVVCEFDHRVEDEAPSKKSNPTEQKKRKSQDRKARAGTGLSLFNEDLEHLGMLKAQNRCSVLSKMPPRATIC